MCRGSGLSSPRSTRLTMSVSTALARHARPSLLALAHDQAVEEFDLGAPALLHVLAHRGTLAGRGAARILEALLVAGRASPPRRLRPRARSSPAAGAGSPRADSRAPGRRGSLRCRARVEKCRIGSFLQHVAAAQAGAGGKPVLHRVGDELRPALAPQIVGHLGAVGISDQAADLLARAAVMRPCTSPARNTVCAAPCLAAPR